MSEKPAILVWRFQEAPEQFRSLSDNGGDEDWLVLVHASMVEDFLKFGIPPWVSAMGACDVHMHTLEDDSVVFIASHS